MPCRWRRRPARRPSTSCWTSSARARAARRRWLCCARRTSCSVRCELRTIPSEAVEALDSGAWPTSGMVDDPAQLPTLADEWEQAAGGTRPARRRAAPTRRTSRARGRQAGRAPGPAFRRGTCQYPPRDARPFLLEHGRVPGPADAEHERLLRARTALLTLFEGLAAAHSPARRSGVDDRRSRRDGPALDRGATFAPRSRRRGCAPVDADGCTLRDFDDVHLVGLVEGEWPRRRGATCSTRLCSCSRSAGRPNPHGSRRRAPRSSTCCARAAAHDGLGFQLEDDSLVGASVLLDDLGNRAVAPAASGRPAAIFTAEALVGRPSRECGPGEAAGWLQLRLARTAAATRVPWHGAPAPPRTHGVGAVEVYAQCPFKYFARHVLRLEEEADDEDWADPARAGHRAARSLRRVFRSLECRMSEALTPAELPRARALLEEVMAAHLRRSIRRTPQSSGTRLLGSPVAPGLADLSCEWRPSGPCRSSAGVSRSSSTACSS